MIVFRQKEYSSATTKLIFKEKKLLNSLRRSKKMKTDFQLKRSAIQSRNKLREIEMNPGAFLGEKVIRPTVEAPITGIASKVVPIPGATATQITVLAPIEKKLYPKPIREGLEKIGKVSGEKAKHAINAAKDIILTNPGTFVPGM